MCSEETTAVSGKPTVFSRLSAVCSSELTALREELSLVLRRADCLLFGADCVERRAEVGSSTSRLSALRS